MILTIQPLAVQNIIWSGEPMLTVFNLETSRAYTYLRQVNGQVLSFRAAGKNTVVDIQTGSIWSASTGAALEGDFIGFTLLPSRTPPSQVFPYHRVTPYPVPGLAIWQRFDANWYISIAENGYGGIRGDLHFPPLFPVLLRLLKPLFGSAFVAGLLIAHLATLYVIKLLYDVYLEWGESLAAKRALAFVLIYPASFFLFSAYSESLFIMATLLSIRFMKSHSWTWAGFWVFCALLTRLQGVVLLIPMLYLMWLDKPFLKKPLHWIGLMLPAFGALLYLYLRLSSVTREVIPLVESELHARLAPPWENYWYAIETLLSAQFTFIDLLNWSVVTLFIILLIAGWQKIPLEYNLYSASSLLVLLSRIVETQPLVSMSRYTLTLFPAFFVLGLASENRWIRRLTVYTFIPLNLYLSAQFFSWGWVA